MSADTVLFLKDLNPYEQLGAMVALCNMHDTYQHWSMPAIGRWFMAPIELGQAAVFGEAGKFVGFTTWAYLSESATADLLQRHIEPEGEWNSGETLWLMDMVSPLGRTREICHLLHGTILRNKGVGRHAYALRRNRQGEVVKAARFPILRD